MRLVVTLIALLLSVFSLGPQAAVASPQGKRVALLVTLNSYPFIAAWDSTFIKNAEASGMKVSNYTAGLDAALQAQQVDDAIAQKFDIIVIIAVNDQAIIPALVRAKAAGVPVIIASSPIEEKYEDLILSYVGTDQTTLGILAAENLVKGLAAEGKMKAQVAAVTGLSSMLNTQLRMTGFRSVLAKHPEIKLVAEEDGKWSTPVSEKITGELLVRFAGHGGLDGIFAMADNQATGVIQAIEAAGVTLGVARKGIVVVSGNCMKDGIAHINEGTQYSTNTQIPTEEAALAVRRIVDYFNGQKLKKNELLEIHTITKENVDQFAKACAY